MRRLLLLLVVVLVNLPAAHEKWTDHELASKGRDVVATVLDGRRTAGSNLVDYRLPRDVDPRQRTFSAALERDAYDRALRTKRLDVRVLPGKPGSNRPAGESGNPLFLVVALGADALLLVVLALAWYRRRRPLAPDDPRSL
ncbi:MAG: hypothetical protein J7518_14770 [Nocardioidaceae bacterium]|nr:hypothetical protein [Nocardioidaceae bacterium]